MKRYKQGDAGHEDVEELNVEPHVPTIEEVEKLVLGARGRNMAGPNETVRTYHDTHESRAQRDKRAPSEGYLSIEIDERDSFLRLPEHPRNQGWIEPDPTKPIFPPKP